VARDAVDIANRAPYDRAPMEVICSACGAPAEVGVVDADHLVATCKDCHREFDFGAQVELRPGTLAIGAARARLKKHRPRVALARGLAFVEAGPAQQGGYRDAPSATRFAIVHPWFSGAAIFLALLVLVWDLSFGVVYWNSQGLLAVLALLCVASGLLVGYVALAGIINRSRIVIDDGILSVQHGPLPWAGNWRLAVARIDQLFCQEYPPVPGSGNERRYTVRVATKDGRQMDLISGLPGREQAIFVEQRIEEHLRIIDVEVEGEADHRAPDRTAQCVRPG
jgi:hypothetical protein